MVSYDIMVAAQRPSNPSKASSIPLYFMRFYISLRRLRPEVHYQSDKTMKKISDRNLLGVKQAIEIIY